MTRIAAVAIAFGIVSLIALAAFHAAPQPPPAAAASRAFHGSWSAMGRRQRLATESGRPAEIVQLSGAVTLTSDNGATDGFHGEVIGFDDGSGVGAGRAVWTDTRGDRVFSLVRGEPLQAGRRVTGVITGGTGRYAGATGEYALTWQYVVAAEEDAVMGRTVDLDGRLQIGERHP